MRRLIALMRKEFTHMRRDPRTALSVILLPLLQLILLGYAANTDVKNVSTAVFDQDNSQASRSLLAAFQSTGYFNLDKVAYSDDDINTFIQGGQSKVGIIIPPNYGNDVNSGRQTNVAVLIDGSDPSVAQAALSAATLVGQSHGSAIVAQQLAARGSGGGGSLPVQVRSRVLYNPDLLSTYNMIPGLIATILMQSTPTLTSFAMVRERERGTIEQLIVTPIRSWELIVAKITPYVFLAMVDVIIILALGTFWFQVPIRGSILLLLTLTGLYLLPNLALGLLISTAAKTQQQAQMMSMPIL